MSFGPVAKLRELVVHADREPRTADDLCVGFTDDEGELTAGDLRSLLAHIDRLERNLTTLQTPSDNERRAFIREAAIALAAADFRDKGCVGNESWCWTEAASLWAAKPGDC